jgi:hypothetical protein
MAELAKMGVRASIASGTFRGDTVGALRWANGGGPPVPDANGLTTTPVAAPALPVAAQGDDEEAKRRAAAMAQRNLILGGSASNERLGN